MNPEGWYLDPFGTHAERWFSDGRPTALVRDGNTEAKDAPPADEFPGQLTPAPETASSSDDLKRADDATRVDQSFSAKEGVDAGFEFNPFC